MGRISLIKSNSGYTVFELMVVVLISGVLVVLATSDYSMKSSRQRLRRTSHQIIADLRLVRQKAISEGTPLSIQFSPDEREYHLPGFSTQVLPNMIHFATLPEVGQTPGGEFENLPQDGVSFNQNKVIFQPNGTHAGPGNIYLTNASNQDEMLAITVNIMGRVKLSKWNGNVWQ